MAIHKIPTTIDIFIDIKDGKKSFLLIKNNLNFAINDTLILEEIDPDFEKEVEIPYTGRAFCVKVKYVLDDFAGLENGYCVMGLTKTRL